MPEGPSIVILREAAAKFRGKTVRRAVGNSSLDLTRMEGRRVIALRNWGKHFLIEFSGFSLRVHMLMFGSYRIDERKPSPPRVSLQFDNGELNIYASSLKYIEGKLDETYDWRTDVMNDAWDPRLARRRLKQQPDTLICDALLDQELFAGVGNIIKNEVLFRQRVHPESTVGALPSRVLGRVIADARAYSFLFLEWKRAFELKKHWQIHTKRTCPTCGGPVSKTYPGKSRRRTFFCPNCQIRY
ncbi:DNA-formamidopyrimidine glycosylase family protein [Stenotrophomonas sp. SORGH_AS_0282]|jgi:endonuclease-8|uniref:DNA-formamidopyrimidine glycosylase family protein n=1 Tax=Stenotrophomonas sp. SORGH_AS_0282 TaxID=3041763 RepID=UPI00277E04BD|nr:DNA-formamidopyrimidine glycosylase family protein [Stenotrophomonas sp. SORGH_AS_0282]MDQ1063422.1 endonuclease-8 [Stenotrophomonas sp. SORGH_AS_0282]MDQ1188218.1 endonuclease-8 [Stenotrophomonas sp. SORGH_AS_0282]